MVTEGNGACTEQIYMPISNNSPNHSLNTSRHFKSLFNNPKCKILTAEKKKKISSDLDLKVNKEGGACTELNLGLVSNISLHIK